MIPGWIVMLFLCLFGLLVGVSVYDDWKKGAPLLISFSSTGVVMLFVMVVVNPERFG